MDINDIPNSPTSPKGGAFASMGKDKQAQQQWIGGGGHQTVPWYYFETAALFNDAPMSDKDWLLHHSWLRHLPQPRHLALHIIGLWPIVLWSVVTSLTVGLYYEFVQVKHPGSPVVVSTGYLQPFLLTSFAVALLLVFRANASYDRFWEARKAFGNMYNCVRNSTRLTAAWLGPSEPELAAEFARWASVLGSAACTFLRDDPEYLLSHDDILSTEELYWLIHETPQPPIAVLQVMSLLLRRSKTLETYERCEIEKQLASFDIVLGACERIRRCSVPSAYTRQTSRLLLTYITFMPMGLWAYTHWLTAPIMATISLLLIGIENIGIQLEQPMMVLPLSALGAGCRAAVEGVGVSQPGALKFSSLCGSLGGVGGEEIAR